MADLLPRLGGAFDESDKRTLDRRQLIRAGAWAAPVLVLATASPAMAAQVSSATPAAPPRAVGVPGGGTGMLPNYLVGATSITAAPWYGAGWDYTGPKLAKGQLYIKGIPQSQSARTVTAYFYVPTSTTPLNRANPSAWKWQMSGSNFSSMTSAYEVVNSTTGVWILTFVMPSWGEESGFVLDVTFP